ATWRADFTDNTPEEILLPLVTALTHEPDTAPASGETDAERPLTDAGWTTDPAGGPGLYSPCRRAVLIHEPDAALIRARLSPGEPLMWAGRMDTTIRHDLLHTLCSALTDPAPAHRHHPGRRTPRTAGPHMSRDTGLTIGRLIHQLQHHPDDTQIRLALRPDFPFTHHIGPLIDTHLGDTAILYLPQGDQDGYLPTSVRTTLGWPPTDRPRRGGPRHCRGPPRRVTRPTPGQHLPVGVRARSRVAAPPAGRPARLAVTTATAALHRPAVPGPPAAGCGGQLRCRADHRPG
uniref:hypothetical protein n=1 Tax=Streptomyces sp. SBT349 TaxID=1580539 RepID=UPI000AEC6870